MACATPPDPIHCCSYYLHILRCFQQIAQTLPELGMVIYEKDRNHLCSNNRSVKIRNDRIRY
jgi:hypothetical protein